MRRALMLVLAVGTMAACGSEEETGPLMRPGDNCLRCHSAGGEASDHPFTAAGTVFPTAVADTSAGVQGAVVRLQAADGGTIELTTNSAGNFFTTRAIAADPHPSVDFQGRTVQMPAGANGACNSCHAQPPLGGAPGRIFVP